MTLVPCITGFKTDKTWTLQYCDTKEPSWNYRETMQIKISCSFLFKQIMHLNRAFLASLQSVHNTTAKSEPFSVEYNQHLFVKTTKPQPAVELTS